MIDWLTLRTPMETLNPVLLDRLRENMLYISCVSKDGEIKWEKQTLDIDSLRSDSPGLYWQIQGDGTQYYLAIGASPASLEYGNNVFGSGDIRYCAQVIISHARKALAAMLPAVEHWQARRIDITFNYLLPGFGEVKQALRHLMHADSGRSKASSMGGDTVGWNLTSDIAKGKAYHKGPQLRKLVKKGLAEASDEQLALADRLLRLELTKGSRWWRRFYEEGTRNWWEITESDLAEMHNNYFMRFFGSVEVTDMNQLLVELEKVAPTRGQALAAHRTWALIKAVGRENAIESIPRATWFRHRKLLVAAGVSDTDLCMGELVPFRRHIVLLNQPVTSWEDLRRVA